LRTLERTADVVEDILSAAIGERNPPDTSAILRQLVELSNVAVPVSPVVVPDAPPAVVETPPPAPPELLRINARNLDDLIRDSSELLVDAAAEAGPSRFAAYADRIDETAREWLRLRRSSVPNVRTLGQQPEFHPIAACLAFIDTRLATLTRDAHLVNEDLGYASRSARSKAERVYQGACRIRMTPAESVFAAFGPMVRDLAQQEGREVVFHAERLETSADLLVLQGLKDPVMHLLRNAVSHGIETPDQRIAAGKPPEGNIRLLLNSRGDRLELIIEDDGRGIDYAGVEQEARARGLLAEDETVEHPEDLGHLIFRAGFSTSKAVTGVSGRGMGLSVVERAVRRLHGEIGLHPRRGGGTRVVISAPISISTQHVLLFSVNGHTFGVSSVYVDTVLRVAPSEIRRVHNRDSVVIESTPIVLAHLAPLLGLGAPAARDREDPSLPCAVLTLSGRRIAFAADRLVDAREAIIKDTGLPEGSAGLTAGAIAMEDGNVAVMLNVNGLFEAASRTRRTPSSARATEPRVARKQRILVVDDSLTTRSLEKSILEAHGYDVRLAVDGLEAWQSARMDPPDLVISDVAMPRMTGFQLLEQMKKDDKMKKIPFILVTSLESREEQQQGLSLGADAYMIKRKFDQRELLNVIREIL
jgi:two-component system chemotaxis sensor kinase CheA